MKITFVVLHYLTIEDTVQCVDSIVNLTHKCFDIYTIVVDNGSRGQEYDYLKYKFQGDKIYKNVILLRSESNLGFARGNNIGYSYAKKKLNSDFIFCINNDTFIQQKNFAEQLIEIYNQIQFDVLGPDIESSKDGMHQNPMGYYTPLTLKVLLKSSIKLLLLTVRDLLHLSKYKSSACTPPRTHSADDILFSQEWYDNEIKLMGAAICFSKNFIDHYDYAFDPITFMYREEDFLAYLIERDQLKVIYTNKLKIYHKEFSSTQCLVKNNNEKRNLFKNKNMFFSTIKLLYRKYIGHNIYNTRKCKK